MSNHPPPKENNLEFAGGFSFLYLTISPRATTLVTRVPSFTTILESEVRMSEETYKPGQKPLRTCISCGYTYYAGTPVHAPTCKTKESEQILAHREQEKNKTNTQNT